MGFTLESMFKELKDKENDLEALNRAITWWKNYAIQCGKMQNEE